jgi:hypothetical protein
MENLEDKHERKIKEYIKSNDYREKIEEAKKAVMNMKIKRPKEKSENGNLKLF